MNTPVSEQVDEQRLLLIDGLNIVRRVYEANPQPDSREEVEGAVKSSFGSFKRALKEIAPTHVLAAFDYGGQTWRHRLYPAYRANRKPMPQALRDALPDLYDQLADRLGVAVVSIPDVEADDVIRSRVEPRSLVSAMSADIAITSIWLRHRDNREKTLRAVLSWRLP